MATRKGSQGPGVGVAHEGSSGSPASSWPDLKGCPGQVHGDACAPPPAWVRGMWQAQPEPPSCRDVRGVYQLASLLMELDMEDEAVHLLAADALYCLGHLDDAHGALRADLAQGPPTAMVLVRLAPLQLRRGFTFEATR